MARKWIRIVPVYKVLFCFGSILTAVNVLRFWGLHSNVEQVLSLMVFCACSTILASWLELRYYISKERIPVGKELVVRTSLLRSGIVVDVLKDTHLLNGLIVVFCCMCTAVFYLIFADEPILLSQNGLFVIIGFLILLIAISGAYKKISWLNEICDCILTVVIPAFFCVMLQRDQQSLLTLSGFIFPLSALFLSYRFVLSMEIHNLSLIYNPGLFGILVGKGYLRVNDFFVSLIPLFLITANRMGVFWRLLYPQLLIIPLLVLEVLIIEQIVNGKNALPYLKILLFSLMFVLLYIQNLTLIYNTAI